MKPILILVISFMTFLLHPATSLADLFFDSMGNEIGFDEFKKQNTFSEDYLVLISILSVVHRNS